MAYGLIDTSYIDFAPGLDESYLRGLVTRSGLRLTEIAGIVDSAMGAINDGADALVADLSFPTTRTSGNSNAVGVKTVTRKGEYTIERSQRIERVSHMLPIDDWEQVIGFTEDGLEDASRDAITEEMSAMVRAWEHTHRIEALTRLFSAAEVPVSKGSTATSPGFAGSGSGTNVFSGQFPNGGVIPSNYTLYGYATEANILTAIKTYRNRLKVWHNGPFDLIASADVIALITALPSPSFVAAGDLLVRPAPAQATVDLDASIYLGVVAGDIRVHMALSDFSEKNLAIYKTYGAFNPNNALAYRYDEMRGRNVTVRDRSLYPLANAQTIQRFGFGVFNRTAVANVFIDNAAVAYAAPTIS